MENQFFFGDGVPNVVFVRWAFDQRGFTDVFQDAFGFVNLSSDSQTNAFFQQNALVNYRVRGVLFNETICNFYASSSWTILFVIVQRRFTTLKGIDWLSKLDGTHIVVQFN